jgi:hypothetical protein
MSMLESCAWFYREDPEFLADVLTQLVTEIRRTLVHPDMGLADKVTRIHGIVDTVAPPPPPEGGEEAARAAHRARTAVAHLAASS